MSFSALDLWAPWGSNKNQWAEGRAARRGSCYAKGRNGKVPQTPGSLPGLQPSPWAICIVPFPDVSWTFKTSKKRRKNVKKRSEGKPIVRRGRGKGWIVGRRTVQVSQPPSEDPQTRFLSSFEWQCLLSRAAVFLSETLISSRPGGGAQCNGSKRGPPAAEFLSETLDVWACWGENKKPMGGGAGCGRLCFFQKPLMCGCAGEDRKSMGRKAGRGRLYFIQRLSMCGRAWGRTKITGPKIGPRAGISLSETLDV